MGLTETAVNKQTSTQVAVGGQVAVGLPSADPLTLTSTSSSGLPYLNKQ